jgi:hypothetical protein
MNAQQLRDTAPRSKPAVKDDLKSLPLADVEKKRKEIWP